MIQLAFDQRTAYDAGVAINHHELETTMAEHDDPTNTAPAAADDTNRGDDAPYLTDEEEADLSEAVIEAARASLIDDPDLDERADAMADIIGGLAGHTDIASAALDGDTATHSA
jgi:hypothetical protein